MSSGTIWFLILVIVGPLAMMWMHRGGHGGHGGHGGQGGHGGSGGGCGGGHSHSRREAEPARQEAEVPRGHAGH